MPGPAPVMNDAELTTALEVSLGDHFGRSVMVSDLKLFAGGASRNIYGFTRSRRRVSGVHGARSRAAMRHQVAFAVAVSTSSGWLPRRLTRVQGFHASTVAAGSAMKTTPSST